MTFSKALAKTLAPRLAGSKGVVSKSIYTWLSSKVSDGSIQDTDLDDPFTSRLQNPYLQNPWVSIAMRIRARCFQRPSLKIYKPSGKEVKTGPLYELFRRPGPGMHRAELIARSMMWWDAEDEFFWLFQDGYRGGIPEEIKVTRPADWDYDEQSGLWYYTDPVKGVRTQMPEETFFRCSYPSMFNKVRGNPRIVSLFLQLEQDYLTTLANTEALRNSGIPRGVLETDQRLTAAQIKDIVDSWAMKYKRNMGNEQIGVAAYGAKFKPLNQELPKYMEFQESMKITTLTMFGVPLKVANATSEKTALSGKDSDEQYKAFWSQTILPELAYIESAFEGVLLPMMGFDGYTIKWDWKEIPELLVDEADQHEQLREDAKANLITLNEARAILHMDPVKWGDTPYYELMRKGDNGEKPAKSFDFFVSPNRKTRKRYVLPIQGELFEEES